MTVSGIKLNYITGSVGAALVMARNVFAIMIKSRGRLGHCYRQTRDCAVNPVEHLVMFAHPCLKYGLFFGVWRHSIISMTEECYH